MTSQTNRTDEEWMSEPIKSDAVSIVLEWHKFTGVETTFQQREFLRGLIEAAITNERAELGALKRDYELSESLCHLTKIERDRAEADKKGLEARLEKARKCDWCGGTDMVCGKGHIESTDELKRQIREVEAENTTLKAKLDVLTNAYEQEVDVRKAFDKQRGELMTENTALKRVVEAAKAVSKSPVRLNDGVIRQLDESLKSLEDTR